MDTKYNGQPITESDLVDAIRGMRDWHNKRLELQQSEEQERKAEIIASVTRTVLREMQDEIKSLRAELKECRKELQAELKTFRDDIVHGIEVSLKGVGDAILATPVPQISVTVPDNAIRVEVEQKPSQVTVDYHAPASPAPIVEVHSPDVNVNVPKVEPNVIVNVQPAETQVNIEAPQPRLTTKKITYDSNGRPETIEEREI